MSLMTAIPVAFKVASVIADSYKFVKDHPDELQQALDDAGRAASAAQKFVGETSDKLGIDDHLARARQSADEAMRIASSTATVFAPGRDATSAQVRSATEAARALDEARQIVLKSADMRTSLPKLSERLSGTDKEVAECLRVLDAPGIFAIATYGKLDLDLNFTNYRGIYVGKAENVGDGLATAISRAGNPDVYADIKYRQNVLVFIFNCDASELRYRSKVLIEVLGADKSYNRPIEEEQN